MGVIIKCDTGFVGATHEEDTGLTIEEWSELTESEKDEWYHGIIVNNIETYAVDEDTDEVVE